MSKTCRSRFYIDKTESRKFWMFFPPRPPEKWSHFASTASLVYVFRAAVGTTGMIGFRNACSSWGTREQQLQQSPVRKPHRFGLGLDWRAGVGSVAGWITSKSAPIRTSCSVGGVVDDTTETRRLFRMIVRKGLGCRPPVAKTFN